MKKFSKYHGCGNDFIIVNGKDMEDSDFSKVAVSWCHRTTGIGADGLLIVNEDRQNDITHEMVIYNSDGSLAPMCGNGIRCFARYCFDENIITEKKYSVRTGAGIINVNINSIIPFNVEINMGAPVFDSAVSSIDTDLPEFFGQMIEVDGVTIPVGTFFMDAIHTIIWDEDLNVPDKLAYAEKISNHKIYKDKTNVNLVKIIDRNTISLITYERGAGLTAACGTGSCAAVVYGIREGRLDRKVKVMLKYGELLITQEESGTVLMEGPAEKTAEGYCFI